MSRKTFLSVVVYTVPKWLAPTSADAELALKRAILNGAAGLDVQDVTTWELGEPPPKKPAGVDLPQMAKDILMGGKDR